MLSTKISGTVLSKRGRPKTGSVINLVELAKTLGWSRNRLLRVLREQPDFPVMQHGDKTTPWKFGRAASVAFARQLDEPHQVAGGKARQASPELEAEPEDADEVDDVSHRDPTDPIRRLKVAQAAIAEHKLASLLGEALLAVEVKAEIARANTIARAAFSPLAGRIAREVGLDEFQCRRVEVQVQDTLCAYFADLERATVPTTTEDEDADWPPGPISGATMKPDEQEKIDDPVCD